MDLKLQGALRTIRIISMENRGKPVVPLMLQENPKFNCKGMEADIDITRTGIIRIILKHVSSLSPSAKPIIFKIE